MYTLQKGPDTTFEPRSCQGRGSRTLSQGETTDWQTEPVVLEIESAGSQRFDQIVAAADRTQQVTNSDIGLGLNKEM